MPTIKQNDLEWSLAVLGISEALSEAARLGCPAHGGERAVDQRADQGAERSDGARKLPSLPPLGERKVSDVSAAESACGGS